MPVATLLNAASANTTGPVLSPGTPTGTLTVAVSTTGTVSAFSVVVQGSVDGTQWATVGSPVTAVTAGTSIGTGVLYQYFQALLSGYSGTGTVTAKLAYSLGAGAGGLPPPTGVTAGSYTNAGITVGADGRLTAASSGSASGMANPMTTAGDLIDGGTGGTPARLGGNTSAAKNFLTSTGTGSAANAPAWGTIASGDVPNNAANTSGTAAGLSSTLAIGSGGTGQASAQLAINALAGAQTSGQFLRGNGTNILVAAIAAADLPAGTTSAQGALQLDGTAGDIAAVGTQAAGAIGKAADAGHVHAPAFFQQFTGNGSVTPAAGTYEIACLGGGGGGAGAGAATGTTLQAGGGGGGSGATVRQYVTLGAGITLTVTVGGGGGGGAVGTANGGAGGGASAGTSTTVTGTGVSILAQGGSPGRPSTGNSTTAGVGGSWGTGALNGQATVLNAPDIPGQGGTGSSASYASGPIDLAAGGGSGGGAASSTLGGGGGVAGTYSAAYTIGGSNGASATAAGVAGGSAAANSGGGGGGGGGGAAGTGAGGAGGNGGSGLVIIRRLA